MRLAAAVLLCWLFSAAPARAVLGQPAASVSSDLRRMGGQLRVTAAQGYSLEQITGADGSVLREYVSPAGLIFGVAWQGPALPNLSQLLGAYFPAFQQAAQQQAQQPGPKRRGPLVIRAGNLVVESGGHMRALQGRAYLADAIPANLSAAVIQ